MVAVRYNTTDPLAGAYILENTPWGKKCQLMSFRRKNMKRPREKGGKCKRKI
jgi:hypothetical protein